jgi:hypothetical protein
VLIDELPIELKQSPLGTAFCFPYLIYRDVGTAVWDTETLYSGLRYKNGCGETAQLQQYNTV